MSKHIMAIASFYQLMQKNGAFSTEHKELKEKRVLVTRAHIERINNQYVQCGKYYVIDEDATEAHFKRGEEITAEIKQEEEAASELTNMLKDSIKQNKKGKKKKAKKVEVIEDESRDESED